MPRFCGPSRHWKRSTFYRRRSFGRHWMKRSNKNPPLCTIASNLLRISRRSALMADKITKRSADYSQWYLDIVQQAGLAENSDVRGCMVIKPHGYAIWEKM